MYMQLMYVMTYISLWFCAQLENQVENSLGVAMIYVVAMVACIKYEWFGERLRSG